MEECAALEKFGITENCKDGDTYASEPLSERCFEDHLMQGFCSTTDRGIKIGLCAAAPEVIPKVPDSANSANSCEY
jgi:hypothetical protein